MVGLKMKKPKIAVVGGGAAGMTAAGCAAKLGCDVTVFERNPSLGRKLGITGKGRCNLTNDCSPDEFIKNMGLPTTLRQVGATEDMLEKIAESCIKGGGYKKLGYQDVLNVLKACY